MNNNINSKTSPNQMRILMKRMREGKEFVKENNTLPKKNLSMRDMLKITRNINEQVDQMRNVKNSEDQGREEQKLRNHFKSKNMSPNIKFIDLDLYDRLVFWGGTIDGIIQFVYKITPDETKNGAEFNYLEDFSPDNPKNDEIIKIIDEYYEIFKESWKNDGRIKLN